MRNFSECLSCIETLWGQNVMALYYHLNGGQQDGHFVDQQLVKIKNCTTINHILVEKGLFDTGFEARLPEIQEDNLIHSIEQFALPFLRERQGLVKNKRGEGYVEDVATTVYRSTGCNDGRGAGTYQSVPQIVEEWLVEIQRQDVQRTETLQAASEREEAIAEFRNSLAKDGEYW